MIILRSLSLNTTFHSSLMSLEVVTVSKALSAHAAPKPHDPEMNSRMCALRFGLEMALWQYGHRALSSVAGEKCVYNPSQNVILH